MKIHLRSYIFILNFESQPEQLSGSDANEIKHGHSYVAIVVLDPTYDLVYL